jgi:hypothetical protein
MVESHNVQVNPSVLFKRFFYCHIGSGGGSSDDNDNDNDSNYMLLT